MNYCIITDACYCEFHAVSVLFSTANGFFLQAAVSNPFLPVCSGSAIKPLTGPRRHTLGNPLLAEHSFRSDMVKFGVCLGTERLSSAKQIISFNYSFTYFSHVFSSFPAVSPVSRLVAC